MLVKQPAAGQPPPPPADDPLHGHPTAFRAFAGLDPDERDGILAFANRFGRLGGRKLFVDPNDPGVGPSPPAAALARLPMGEPADIWADEILAMRRAVELWDAYKGDRADALARLIRRDEKQSREAALGIPKVDIWVYDTHRGLADQERPRGRDIRECLVLGDYGGSPPAWTPREAAATLLGSMVNERINGEGPVNVPAWKTESPVRWREPTANRVDLAVVLSPDGTFGIRKRPTTLLAGLWLQLGRAMCQNVEHRPCRFCEAWFGVSADDYGRTTRREFCSGACKARDSGRRHKRAGELKGEGKTVPQIVADLKAEGLETDVETVKKWLRSKKG